jgi:hypothetical protein
MPHGGVVVKWKVLPLRWTKSIFFFYELKTAYSGANQINGEWFQVMTITRGDHDCNAA